MLGAQNVGEKDAARYRWLQLNLGNFINSLPRFGGHLANLPLIPLGKQLDDAIDTAMLARVSKEEIMNTNRKAIETETQRRANAYPRLVEALRELVERCDGTEGIRAYGAGNIQTMAASALLLELGEL